MNTVKTGKSRFATRSLALAVLVAIIFFIAWLSIQIINVAPSAFSSLASLASGISQYQETIIAESTPLEINETTTIVDSGEATSISWMAASEGGTYAFSHNCVEGVSLSILNEDGVRDIECGTNYNLGGVSEVTIIANSQATDYVDIPYTISYSRLNETEVFRTGSASVTVANKEVEEVVVEATATSTEEVAEETTPTEDPSESEVTYEFEYKIPVSNPNGFTDLVINFVSVGGIIDGRYVSGVLEQNSTGAVQFEVKNIGTKTSEDWEFSITLPDGSTYRSDSQVALKPNERATLTIGIQTGNDSSHTFVGRLSTDEDSASVNNSFSRSISIRE